MTKGSTAQRPCREPTRPGAPLREDVLPSLGVSVTEFGKLLGVGRQQLHRILSGDSGVSPEMALKLGKLCGKGPEVRSNMQVALDLWRVREALGSNLESIEQIKLCA